jgi:hypothetical protein
MKRRLFLALALGVCVLRVSSVTGAQNATELSFTLKPVGANVWAAISNPQVSGCRRREHRICHR